MTTTTDYDAIKERQHATWSSGNYANIGTTLQLVGETLCEAVDVVFISPHEAIAHANVSYPQGIRLEGGEKIRPYSEIHTFVIAGNAGRWRIFGHNVTKQVSPGEL